ncbi:anti-sigma-D factor RsdA [Mycobacterium sp. MMS18-G62]
MPDFGRWTSNGGDPSLNEINRTDRFLDSLAYKEPVYSTDPGEAELAQLFAGWRDELRDPPLMAPVTPRDAAITLRRAVESRKRTRTSMAVVGSLAAAVLCLGGFGAVVGSAGPGDALYGLRTALFGEQQTTRTDAVALASQQLAEVQQLIDTGQWDAAQDKLQTLTTTVATVNDVEQKQDLVDKWQQLTVKVDAKDANATLPPGVPPPVMPEPAVVEPGSSTSTSATSSSPSSETSTSTSPSSDTSTSTTTSPSTSVVEPPPVTTTLPVTTTTPPPVTTTTPPPVTTTTPPVTTTTTVATTTHVVTTTTTAPPGPVAGGSPEVVAPPTAVVEAPKSQSQAVEAPKTPAPQSPVIEAPATETVPVTTTTLVIAPPKAGARGE